MLAHSNETEAVTTFVSPGSLASHLPEWRLCTKSKWILDTVRNGYELQFVNGPPPFVGLIHTRALGEADTALRLEIEELQRKGCHSSSWSHTEAQRILRQVLLVPKSDGSFRSILDLRRLNSFLQLLKLRMLTPREMLLAFTQEITGLRLA